MPVLLLLTLSLVAILTPPSLAAAVVFQDFIPVSTGFSTTDYAGGAASTTAVQDANWLVLPPHASMPQPAWTVDFVTMLGWPANDAQSAWVAIVPYTTQQPRGTANFSFTFQLPSTARLSSAALTVDLGCAPSCTLLMNGHSLASYHQPSGSKKPLQLVTASTGFSIGLNTLTVVNPGTGQAMSAVRVAGNVSYAQTSPAPPAVVPSFPSLGELSGLVLSWASSPQDGGYRGCPATYALSGVGVGTDLTPLPCDLRSEVALSLHGPPVDLSLYAPLADLTVVSPDHSVYYSVLGLNPLSGGGGASCLLAAFSENTGAVLQLLAVPTGYSPLALEVNPKTGLLYLLALPARQPTQVTIFVLDITAASSWSTALQSTATFSPDTTILPHKAQLLIRGASGNSALLPSGQLLLIVGSVVLSPLSAPHWQLVSITPSTGAYYSLTLSDPAVLQTDSLVITALHPSQQALVSSNFGVWLLNLTGVTKAGTVTATRLSSVDTHLQRATVALGCGQLAMAVDVLPTTVPSSSSVPYAVLMLWAQPTLLSAIPAPFWYFLFVDPVLDIVTYSSIDSPPLHLDALAVAPSVSALSGVGNKLGYDPSKGVTLTYLGSNFSQSDSYSCQTATALVAAAFVNSSAVRCSLPRGLPADNSTATSFSSSTLQVQLLNDGVFVLYSSNLLLLNSSTPTTRISRSSVVPALSRMIVSYYVSSSLNAAPVIPAASGLAFAPTTTASGQLVHASPLQLHTQTTRDASFVSQQLLNLSSAQPQLRADSIIDPVRNALSNPNWFNSVGLSDAYSMLARAANGGSSDYSTITGIASGQLAVDLSSLPQTLTGLQLDGASSSLALDVIGSQAQGYIEQNVLVPRAPNLQQLLSQGALLTPLSSQTLQQLTAISVNALLQDSNNNALIKGVLADSQVARLIQLPSDLTSTLSDPSSLLSSQTSGGGGSITDIASALLGGGGGGSASLAGEAGDVINSVLGGITQALSGQTSKVAKIVSSFIDDISGSVAAAFTEDAFGGLAGGIATFVCTELGASPLLTNIISSGVQVVGGVAEFLLGDVVGGITDIAGGISGFFSKLFGGGGSSSSSQYEQLDKQLVSVGNEIIGGLNNLSKEVAEGFNAVVGDLSVLLNTTLQADEALSKQVQLGFTELSQEINASTVALGNEISSVYTALSNLTIRGFTQLQQQEQAEYSSEMQALSNIGASVQSLSFDLLEVQSQLSALLAAVDTAIEDDNSNARNALLSTLESYMALVTDAVSESQPGFPVQDGIVQRRVKSSYHTQYTSYLAEVCAWTTTASVNNAAASVMSGDPSQSSSSFSQQINLAGHFDLVFSLLPLIVGSYLQLPVPASLPSALPNPLAFAFAANFWMEARQAALQTSNADTPCVQDLWAAGTQLQVAVRLAVAPSTLNAAYAKLQAVTAGVQSALTTLVAGNYLTASEWFDLLSADLSLTQLDEALAVARLLLSLSKAAGLGGNGFTNGFVSSGASGDSSPSTSFQPGQSSTSITPFFIVSDSQSYLDALTNSLNATSNALPGDQVVQQSASLLQLTLNAMQNAIEAFYCPCGVAALTASTSLPVVDTTLRRLAGYMMQTQVSFTYQGSTVRIAGTKPLKVQAPVSSSSTAAAPARHHSSSAISSSSSSAKHKQ